MKKCALFLLMLSTSCCHLFAGPVMPWSGHRPEDEQQENLGQFGFVIPNQIHLVTSNTPVTEPDMVKNGFRTGVYVVAGGIALYGAGVAVASSLAERRIYMPHAVKAGATATTGYGLFKLFTDRRKWHWFGFTVPAALTMATAFAGHYFYKQLQKRV